MLFSLCSCREKRVLLLSLLLEVVAFGGGMIKRDVWVVDVVHKIFFPAARVTPRSLGRGRVTALG